jgi:LCP family protein required for cell wall assembly
MSPLQQAERMAIWKKFLIGSLLIVLATAGATSVAAFHEVDKVVSALEEGGSIKLGKAKLAIADPGKPRTILLLGSDRRPKTAKDGGAGAGGRSDTIILARLDPGKKATALMSLPRDLKVNIPGHGTDKINAAYELGGPALMLRTVQELTDLPINHVINVDFKGFEKAINAIGCIYADIDRRYYNDTAAYAYIKVPAGYQRMCGFEALQFARFRHEDSDLVRGVRQQEVIKAVKQQISVSGLIGKRDELVEIFGKYTTSDSALKDRKEIISLAKLAIFSASQPIKEVQFKGEVGITGGPGQPSYVVASPTTVRNLVQQFLGVEESKGPKIQVTQKGKKKRKARGPTDGGGLERAPVPGKEQAIAAIAKGAGGQLPVYYPTVRLAGSQYIDTPRYYKIKSPDGKRHKAYRMVLKRGLLGEYYGVQGTTWKDPPILDGASDNVKVKGRTYEFRYDGDRVQTVAWRTKKAVYWISNTLLQSLSKAQMLAIARTAKLP